MTICWHNNKLNQSKHKSTVNHSQIHSANSLSLGGSSRFSDGFVYAVFLGESSIILMAPVEFTGPDDVDGTLQV